MEKKPIAYRLVPVYPPDAESISSAAMMQCMYSGVTLSSRGGGGDVLSPEIVNDLRERKVIHPDVTNPKITITVTPEGMERLNFLVDTCKLADRGVLVNNALTIMEWAVQRTLQGDIIAAVNETEKRYTHLVMPALEAAAEVAKEKK